MSKTDNAMLVFRYFLPMFEPVEQDNDKAGWFLTTSEAVKPWLQSRKTDAAWNSRVLGVPTMALSH
ncbi:hypothetical protein TSUD_378470 [Trifolium subterraneum]|uniref:Uncharacterized protein n=1 Tax=Trifolium subterraneum TaxID=3900 RepID=A0A2Z6N5E2_TRISU|nr:hypothetical protein TSUD_378470 [Trifolium subterraneum]